MFESHCLFSFRTIELIQYSIVDYFGSLNYIFKHCSNLLLFNSLLYIPLFITHKRLLVLILVWFILLSLFLLFWMQLKFLINLILLDSNWSLRMGHICKRTSNLIAPWRRWLINSSCCLILFGILIQYVNFFLCYDWGGSNQVFINFPLPQWIQGYPWTLLIFGTLEQRWLLLLLFVLPHF